MAYDRRNSVLLPKTYDQHRSVHLRQLLLILDVPDCSFISLQLGSPTDRMKQLPHGLTLQDVRDSLVDWADTANLMMGLDLIITVDTGVANLAGALGRPTWLLNRFDSDWRWGRQGERTPWYPSIHIFRQPVAGDWASPVAEIARALRAMSAAD